jgi:hypothetical protein
MLTELFLTWLGAVVIYIVLLAAPIPQWIKYSMWVRFYLTFIAALGFIVAFMLVGNSILTMKHIVSSILIFILYTAQIVLYIIFSDKTYVDQSWKKGSSNTSETAWGLGLFAPPPKSVVITSNKRNAIIKPYETSLYNTLIVGFLILDMIPVALYFSGY